MATIITKFSSTASAVPTSSDLVQGELAVNTADKRLFTEDSGATIIELGTNPTSVTTGAITASGNVTVGGNLSVTGNATISGNLTFGDADTDSIALNADVDSNILPNTDDTYDLGSATKEWRNLYIDGIANIDSLVADTADINGGTVDGAIIGGSSAAAGTFTTATATTGNITTLNSTTVDTTSLEVTNLKAKDGTSAGSIADSTGVVTIASSVLTTTDINGGSIDGTTIGSTSASTGNFSTLSIGGTAITATAAELNLLDGVTSTTAELNILDGVTSTASELNLVDGSSAGTIVNSKAVVYGATGEVNATTLQVGGVAITSTPAELNVLDGITSTTAELNYTDGVTSNIQTQLDAKAPLASPTFTGTVTIPAATVTGDVSFGDNDKAIFGAGSDLQIYHDGSNSYIAENGTGNLVLKGTNLTIESSTGENYFVAFSNADTRLYYDNAQKLATTSTGIDVTGTATMDGLTVDGSGTAQITSTSGTTLELIRSGSAGQISSLIMKDGGNAQNRISSSGGALEFEYGASSLNALKIDNNGDISFYEDTGTTPKFFWDASAESLGIGTSSPTSTAGLHIQGADGASGSTVNVAANEFFIDNNGNTGMTLGSSNTGSGGYVFADSDVALRAGMFYDHSNDQMTFRVASQTRVSIDSSGNVGIGTTPESHYSGFTAIDLGASATIWSNRTTGDTNTSGFGNNVYFNGTNWIYKKTDEATSYSQANGNHVWYYAASGTAGTAISFSEAMRIDSSGNLLVGKTAPSNNNVGQQFAGAGGAGMTRDGGIVCTFNRKTSDGTLLNFEKDGTTVGSIGTASSELYFSSGNTGLYFDDVNNLVRPTNSAGALRDNITDLGKSDSRFKDLYLSGGVYLGGTGAANKLDDYEEGTWTPAVEGATSAGSATYSFQAGNYTKVGNLVMAAGRVTFSGHTGTGNMQLHGLPFTSTDTGFVEPSCVIHGVDISLTANNTMVATVKRNDSFVEVLQATVGGGSRTSVPMDSAGTLYFTIIYQAA